MRALRCVAAVAVGAVLLLATGCGMGPKEMQIQELQEQVNQLQAEKADLISQLARARSERDAARQREMEMAQRLRQLQDRMAQGEPTETGIWTERPGIAWTDVADDILFDSGKAVLKQTGRTELQKILDELRQRWPDRQVWVIGHTDSDPIRKSNWKDNLELSLARSATVYRELQSMGVDPRRMVAAGQGEHNPKAPNEPRSKHQNRRVQIIAVQLPDLAGGVEGGVGG